MLVRDRLPHRHVGRVVVCYQGGGVSAQPQNVRDGQQWCDEQKRELFAAHEHAIYAGILAARGLGKKMAYDTLLWRVLRAIRGKRRVRARRLAEHTRTQG